jgi:GTPase SAR1 family protein
MKIGFTGTMSVGKTTLVNALKELPEFKDYNFKTERSKYLRDLGIPLNTDSTLKGQIIFLAERCSELFQDNVITDRTIIDVMAFTSLAKTIPVTQNTLYETLASKILKEYDYIFYISPDGVGIEDNGVRTTDPEYRDQVNSSIQDIITKYQGSIQNLIVLNGSVDERVQQIKQTLNL